MSGIAGIIHFDGKPVEPGQVEAMTATMHHRGPDGSNHWRGGNVAMGHCMLRTTPESLEETQPSTSEDENLVLVWDGRLDNREELRRSILQSGGRLRNNSDAELVMQSFAIWREQCPLRLLGDFAFAVWNKTRQEFFCTVDHIGARPLYYTLNKGCFAFASEEESLLVLPEVSGRPNELQIADMLVLPPESFDSQYSWLHDVKGLMPGNSLVVTRDGALCISRYWQLDAGTESAYSSDEECQEAFLSVFAEAVSCRMRSAGPVAAMMSGGMDSAGISAMVRRLLPEMPGKQFHTYSAIADEPENCVESQCILRLTKGLHGNAHFVSVPSFKGMANVQDLIEVAWSKPHPVDNSILLPAIMCKAAGVQGHRVMLTGVSGDLTMAGPDKFPAHLLRKGDWRQAWSECKAISENHTLLRGASPAMLLLKNAWAAYAPVTARSLVFWMRHKETWLASGAINADFVRKLDLAERLRLQITRRAMIGASSEDHRQGLARFNGGPWGLVSGLSGYDRVAGRYGVELRDPWADKRVVEFFLRLPFRYKLRNGWTKHLARTAFALDLDDKVRWRRGKEHLGPHFYQSLMDEWAKPALQRMVVDLQRLTPYVNIGTLWSRYSEDREGTDKNTNPSYSMSELVALERWIHRIELGARSTSLIC